MDLESGMQTRSKTLKRDLRAVEEDEGKQKARKTIEPLLKRARTVAGPTAAAKSATDEEIENALTDDERAEITMVFHLFDTDRDGHISQEELEAVLRNLGFRPSPAEVGAIMKDADVDDSGTIELNEFISLMGRLELQMKEEEAEREEQEKKEKEKEEQRKLKEKERKKKQKEEEKKNKKKAKAAPAKDKKKQAGEEKKGKKASAKGKEKKGDEEDEEEEKRDKKPMKKPPPRRLRRGDSTLQLKRTQHILKLNRGLSISDFYTNYAGMHDEINPLARDKFDNPLGAEYDLGHEGAFGRFSVIVGLFCLELTEKVFMENAGLALQQKGFRVTCVNEEKDFTDRLNENDVGVIISDQSSTVHTPALAEACLKYHQSGGGLSIWADNAPFFVTANAVLAKLFPGGVQLTGDTPGDNDLKVGESGDKSGNFARHLITSGIQTLYEGVTICHPTPANQNDLKVLATSTDGNPCMLYADYDRLEDHCGRIHMDCGFTKLGYKWDTAGTARYVRNVCVWLLGLEHRIRIGAPLQGRIAKEDLASGSGASSAK